MIRITDKSLCTGCTACVTSCPVQCIVMRRDRQGFDYPVANPDLCIGCGKCETVCPVLNPSQEREPLAAYACRCGSFVKDSSSGGVFPFIAGKVLDDGGVVFGAVMNPDMTVGHSEADNHGDMKRMCGSKYVQSDLYSTFEDVKAYLEEGRKVLFTGTPCQVSGLHSYLGKHYDELVSVDVACHGVPSPGLWEKYADCLGRKCGGRITDVRFRDKSSGWRYYSFTAWNDRQTYSVPYVDDPYMALFVQDMTLRPSCYSCPFRKGESGSDITLADLWNVGRVAGGYDDDKGTSLVIAYSDKGMGILDGLDLLKVDCRAAMADNGGFAGPSEVPLRREEFFQGMHSAKDIAAYMRGFVTRRPLHVRIYRRIRAVLSGFKKMLMK